MSFPDVNTREERSPLLPVRRLHNYVYCPRLFYLQWVENIFVPNEDTVTGSALHSRVDDPTRLREEALTAGSGKLRSVALSSETLGITGVADLVDEDATGRRRLVDYKKGSPLRGADSEWIPKPNDEIQLAAYAAMLAEQGVQVDCASVYYAETKRHVPVELTDDLFAKMRESIAHAVAVAESGHCPPPLCSSRCFACSCFPVCLPFETRRWMQESSKDEAEEMRPPMPAGDEGEILIVQNNRASVGLRGGEIVTRMEGEEVSRHPIHQLRAVYLYGAIQVSAQAVQALLENDVSVSWFSPAGRFIGCAQGLPSSGVDARMGQYRLWGMPERRLAVASEIIRAKIHNQRVILMRNGKADDAVLARMARLRDSCCSQPGLDALRGVEGTAAALYFESFASMLRENMPFDFNGRNRRPPRDEVNAMLSLGYSVLTKELTGLAYAVGLDPFLGFFHSPRYGKPALALDMMEEFRPLIVDSVVISLINRREVGSEDFEHTAKGVMMKDSGRRQFWRAWTRRMDTEVTHPAFGYKMSYRRMMEVQLRQFWRFCRGDIEIFSGFTTR
ncbi:MAG: CRISPR-associated endonuclease Cas1 [Akkermansia sp.]|nr:CRISPR-associated endonuclease Cas1 [Akkermansia sp.]